MDIKKDEDDLLASLPQKGRHAIRRAERDGVTIERVPATIANCKKMFSLLKKTAEGQFGLRPYDYYQQYWQAFSHAGHGQLFFARFEGKVVAGAYAMALGKKTTYKDGASSRKRTVYGASHLLQWEVIRWAKERGATLHDLCGSPPSDQIDNLQHPHYGIGRFKLSLSKNVVDYIGCMDVVIRPRSYRLWKLTVERIYQRLFYKRHRDYYY